MSEVQKVRYNIRQVVSINDFANIKGKVIDNCKDVNFVRAIGVNASYVNDIKALDELLDMKDGKGFYKRVSGLKRLQEEADIRFYSACHAKWVESGKTEVTTRAIPQNTMLSKTLGNACAVVEKLYDPGSIQTTDSILKNLIVKILFWFDEVFDGKEFVWDETKSLKIVAGNVEKKQEYLFYYLLTLVGCDVLLLQSAKDIGTEEEKLNLSTKFVLGEYAQIIIPDSTEHKIRIQIPKRERSSKRQTVSDTAQINAQSEIQTNTQQTVRISAQSIKKPNVQANTAQAVHTSQNSVSEKSFEELARLASSVVMIVVHDETGKPIGGGSGIMIGQKGYILTNCHVACRGRSYSIRIEEDENVYQTDELIKYNQMLDLAVLRIEKNLNPLPIYKGSKELVRGQKVVAIGSPLGLFNSVSDGIISGFRHFEDVDMIQFTAPISNGSSGGAVLNMNGEVIGISTAGYDDGQNLNLAVGYECINMFIKGFV